MKQAASARYASAAALSGVSFAVWIASMMRGKPKPYGLPKPSVSDVLPVVQALYRRHCAGCCWHVVLDDNNYDSVEWTVSEYGVCDEPECQALAIALPLMSRTQMRKLARSKR